MEIQVEISRHEAKSFWERYSTYPCTTWYIYQRVNTDADMHWRLSPLGRSWMHYNWIWSSRHHTMIIKRSNYFTRFYSSLASFHLTPYSMPIFLRRSYSNSTMSNFLGDSPCTSSYMPYSFLQWCIPTLSMVGR